MKRILHKAETRGTADYGWLKSHHSFSFGSYHDSQKMGFGALRVINDDVVAPSRGFATHPHQNMEIISIPLKGALKHKDTIGNEHVIQKGDVQVMSAGTGIEHSEYNNSKDHEANFLQVWVLPKKINIKPSYDQKEFLTKNFLENIQLIVSPDGRENSAIINQNAFFSLAKIQKSEKVKYSKYLKENGVYFFVLEGSMKINDIFLESKDGLGIEELDVFEMVSDAGAEVLIMEVPMK